MEVVTSKPRSPNYTRIKGVTESLQLEYGTEMNKPKNIEQTLYILSE